MSSSGLTFFEYAHDIIMETEVETNTSSDSKNSTGDLVSLRNQIVEVNRALADGRKEALAWMLVDAYTDKSKETKPVNAENALTFVKGKNNQSP